ncbi:MAG: LysR family transcriptional regulator [Verrucomicrobiales bacterium]
MNIHHLELFYYVAHHGGIMGAVRHMPYGIQQPAVSGQILQLEADLGMKLFERRPFALTAAGKELFEHIAPFFSGLDAVGERIRGGQRQLLRLAAPDPVLREHLPDILRQVRAQFPSLRVTLRSPRQDLIESFFRSGEIDFAIAPLADGPPSGITHSELLELRLALVVPKECPFMDAGALLDALADGTWFAPLITRPSDEIVPRCFREVLAQRGFEWRPAIEVESLDMVEVYVARGFGVGLAVIVPGQGRNPQVRLLPLPECPPLKIAALWRGKLTPALDALLRAVKERAKNLAAE